MDDTTLYQMLCSDGHYWICREDKPRKLCPACGKRYVWCNEYDIIADIPIGYIDLRYKSTCTKHGSIDTPIDTYYIPED